MSPRNYANLTFEQWYAKANRACARISTLTLDDLPDGNSYDAFLDDATPKEYAVMVLEEEGFPFSDEVYDAPAASYDAASTGPTAPYGETYVDTVTLHNGETVTVRRSHSRNGKVEVIK